MGSQQMFHGTLVSVSLSIKSSCGLANSGITQFIHELRICFIYQPIHYPDYTVCPLSEAVLFSLHSTVERIDTE